MIFSFFFAYQSIFYLIHRLLILVPLFVLWFQPTDSTNMDLQDLIVRFTKILIKKKIEAIETIAGLKYETLSLPRDF